MRKNLLEWIVFGLSVVLIISLLGYLSFHALTHENTPPDLRVQIAPEQDQLKRNVYLIEVVNKGEQTAENVTIEVSLMQQGKEIEKAQTQFPLAPKESIQKAWVTFRTPRQKGQTTQYHILGYNHP